MHIETNQEPAPAVRVTVSYCVRCGALRIHPEEDTGAVCPDCRRRAAYPAQGNGR